MICLLLTLLYCRNKTIKIVLWNWKYKRISTRSANNIIFKVLKSSQGLERLNLTRLKMAIYFKKDFGAEESLISYGSLREDLSENQQHSEYAWKPVWGWGYPAGTVILPALESIPYGGHAIKHSPFLTTSFFSDSKLVKKSFKNLLPFAVCLLHGFLTSRFKESYGPLHKGKKWCANIHAIFHAILGDDCGDHPDTPRPKGENVLSQNNIWTSWQFYFSR